ncbi:hypothetical protein, conserved [Eimeria tenella]|uniref:Uncharacterized protein n=1 Tax=Eimeria tenella TaxID=5802 RepID=U6L497_EIMTE|nr:hypothetical protein, conserved [Eimeria tenella]CDJ42600.1 hypothetical protein, conserved [Eimeria tenella]|eukprot:XP_013233350.1 hypothetical protein, conserved [Eimeria tenella]
MLAQGQLASVSESRSHLLLLPDIRLSHFPFESLPVLKRLFGYRISRDFSLHMFARRMQHHDSISPANQPKRTLAEMHCGFSRESLLLLPEATDCQNLQNMAKSGKQTTEEESQVAGLPVNDGTATAKSADCPPAFSTFLPPQREPKSDWRPPVVADLLSAKQTSSMDGTPESPPCSSFIPELLCTKAPQAAWALSLNKIVRDSDDINCAIVGMNLMHISLLGLLLMREKPSHCEAYLRQGQQLRPTTSYSQTLEISKGVQTLLMLSTRGVGTIIAVDDELTDQQKADFTTKFLIEMACTQSQVSCALESLSTVPEKGGRPRLSTKRHLHHRVETSVHDSPLETTLSEYRLEYERSEKGDPATGVRVYGLPWIGRLGGQKGSSKPDSQKPLQPKNRK